MPLILICIKRNNIWVTYLIYVRFIKRTHPVPVRVHPSPGLVKKVASCSCGDPVQTPFIEQTRQSPIEARYLQRFLAAIPPLLYQYLSRGTDENVLLLIVGEPLNRKLPLTMMIMSMPRRTNQSYPPVSQVRIDSLRWHTPNRHIPISPTLLDAQDTRIKPYRSYRW